MWPKRSATAFMSLVAASANDAPVCRSHSGRPGPSPNGPRERADGKGKPGHSPRNAPALPPHGYGGDGPSSPWICPRGGSKGPVSLCDPPRQHRRDRAATRRLPNVVFDRQGRGAADAIDAPPSEDAVPPTTAPPQNSYSRTPGDETGRLPEPEESPICRAFAASLPVEGPPGEREREIGGTPRSGRLWRAWPSQLSASLTQMRKFLGLPRRASYPGDLRDRPVQPPAIRSRRYRSSRRVTNRP